MALQISTGLATAVVGTSSLATALAGGVINIYAGTPPPTADAALGGATLLCSIQEGGTNPLYPVASGTKLVKPTGETWQGANAATGTATFYRYVKAGDDGTASTSQVRAQGNVGLTNASEMTLLDVAFVSGETFVLANFMLNLPLHP